MEAGTIPEVASSNDQPKEGSQDSLGQAAGSSMLFDMSPRKSWKKGRFHSIRSISSATSNHGLQSGKAAPKTILKTSEHKQSINEVKSRMLLKKVYFKVFIFESDPSHSSNYLLVLFASNNRRKPVMGAGGGSNHTNRTVPSFR